VLFEGVRLGIVLGMAHLWGGVPVAYYVETLHIMTKRQTWLPIVAVPIPAVVFRRSQPGECENS
jgi:hypothetical protein